jgi:peptidyl-prolyl cis-trans isomerase C
MKKTYIAVLFLTTFSLYGYAADIASVNGKPIKQSLVDYLVKDVKDSGNTVDDNVRATIVDKLITNELLNQEALKAGVEKRPDFLAKEELALYDLRIEAYIADYIKKNPIDDKALQAEYERQKTIFKGKDYKARHILVKTENEAKDIIKQLAKGSDFGGIAKEKSIDTGSAENGGDLGWFQPETMVKPFSDAVAKLDKGAYTTTPIQTDFGWHVIKLDDTRTVQPVSFELAKGEIRKLLVREQLIKLVSDLKAKATIVNNSSVKAEK